jgi:hypothetical protein
MPAAISRSPALGGDHALLHADQRMLKHASALPPSLGGSALTCESMRASKATSINLYAVAALNGVEGSPDGGWGRLIGDHGQKSQLPSMNWKTTNFILLWLTGPSITAVPPAEFC